MNKAINTFVITLKTPSLFRRAYRTAVPWVMVLSLCAIGGVMWHRGDTARSQFEAAIDDLDGPRVIIDSDGIIRHWTPDMYELFGYFPPEIIGKHVSIILPPEIREEHQNRITSSIVLENIGKAWYVRSEGVHRDGRPVPIMIRVVIAKRLGRAVGVANFDPEATVLLP